MSGVPRARRHRPIDSVSPSTRTSVEPRAAQRLREGVRRRRPTDAHAGAEQARSRSAAGVSSATRRVLSTATRFASALHFVEVVRREQDGAPLVPQPQHELAHVAGALGIETRRRLVEQHDGRVVQQRARQRHALLQALRELRRGLRGAVADVEELERRVHGRSGCGRPCSRA